MSYCLFYQKKSLANAACYFRDVVPSWITDEEGKQSQQYVWDLIATELESIESGCVKRILQEL